MGTFKIINLMINPCDVGNVVYGLRYIVSWQYTVSVFSGTGSPPSQQLKPVRERLEIVTRCELLSVEMSTPRGKLGKVTMVDLISVLMQEQEEKLQ